MDLTPTLKIYLQNEVPNGFGWELGDANGTIGEGSLNAATAFLEVGIPAGNSQRHEYILRFTDAEGVPYPHAKLDYADGGIVIVENLDIHEVDPSRSTTTAKATKDIRAFEG